MITGGTGDYAAINGGGQIEGVGVTNADGTLTVTDNWDGKIAFP
jgi:hypothetical protein